MWFRQDLRLADNQAFRAAAKAASARGGELLCVYVWSEDEEGDDDASWGPGEASRVWLHLALDALDRDISARTAGRRSVHARTARPRARGRRRRRRRIHRLRHRTPRACARSRRRARRRDARRASIPRVSRDAPGHLLFHPSRVELDMSEERYFFGTLMPFVHAAERRGAQTRARPRARARVGSHLRRGIRIAASRGFARRRWAWRPSSLAALGRRAFAPNGIRPRRARRRRGNSSNARVCPRTRRNTDARTSFRTP